MDRKWVYRFDELEAAEATAGDWEAVRGLLGGKGANLAEMSRIKVPVPPGLANAVNARIRGTTVGKVNANLKLSKRAFLV